MYRYGVQVRILIELLFCGMLLSYNYNRQTERTGFKN